MLPFLHPLLTTGVHGVCVLLADTGWDVSPNRYLAALWDLPNPVVVNGKSSTCFMENWCGHARLSPSRTLCLFRESRAEQFNQRGSWEVKKGKIRPLIIFFLPLSKERSFPNLKRCLKEQPFSQVIFISPDGDTVNFSESS